MNLQVRGTEVRHRLRKTYRHLDRRSSGRLGVLRRAGQGYADTQAAQAAAALAYYVFFSLFPLLFLLVSAATYILDLGSDEAFQSAVQLISQAIPVSQDLIRSNLAKIVNSRGTVGLVGLAATLWSSSSAFTILTQDINEAFADAPTRGVVKTRLMGMLMVAAVVLLLFLSLGTTTAVSVIRRLPMMPELMPFLASSAWSLLSRATPLIFSFLLFLALFQWVPTKRVHWPAALSGAAITAIAWELAKELFSLYLTSGLARYTVVYGPLSSVIVLMFWIYISGAIALFGAHLTAALDQQHARTSSPPSPRA